MGRPVTMVLLLIFAAMHAAANTTATANVTAWQHTYADGTTLKVSSVASGIVRIKTVPRGAEEDFTPLDLTLPQPKVRS